MAFFGELARFDRKYPELRVETKISNSPSILLDKGFDVLIRGGRLEDDSTLVARPLEGLEMVLGASPSYLEEYGAPNARADLERHRWLLHAKVDNVYGMSPHWEFFREGERCAVTVSTYLTLRHGTGCGGDGTPVAIKCGQQGSVVPAKLVDSTSAAMPITMRLCAVEMTAQPYRIRRTRRDCGRAAWRASARRRRARTSGRSSRPARTGRRPPRS